MGSLKPKTLISQILIITIFYCGCSSEDRYEDDKKSVLPNNPNSYKLTVDYASGFTVDYQDNTKLITVKEPYRNASEPFKYLLVSGKDHNIEKESVKKVIQIPVHKIVVTSTTHIPLLDLIEVSNSLKGFPGLQYISSEKMRKRIENGGIKDLGSVENFNLELLFDLDPDMLMGYMMNSDYGIYDQIERAGIPVVINAEYLEKSPLGRSEWIKFISLFFNKEKTADSVFKFIENEYLLIKEKVTQVESKPTVYSGIVYGDTWFMPGGNSWHARFFKDAGADFLWNDDQSEGSLELSFEAVYDRAHDADYWIGAASFNSLEEIRSKDPRYANFKAFQNGNVYTYNKRVTENGGNDYFETGFARPDIVIKDLVKILHPELLPEYSLYFYQKLE